MVDRDRFAEKMYFRYHNDWIKDENGKDVPVPRPKLEVIFRKYSETTNPETNPEFRTHALVDSGADISFIPKQIAEILKIELDEKTKKISKSASEEFAAYRSSVFLEVMHNGRRVKIGTIEVAIPEKYAKSEDLQKMILLGRKGFFDQYQITFNEHEKNFVLKKIHTNQKGFR